MIWDKARGGREEKRKEFPQQVGNSLYPFTMD